MTNTMNCFCVKFLAFSLEDPGAGARFVVLLPAAEEANEEGDYEQECAEGNNTDDDAVEDRHHDPADSGQAQILWQIKIEILMII